MEMQDIPFLPGGVLRDESRFAGTAHSVSMPRSPEEVCRIVAQCRRDGIPITPRGSLTAINGAGVPAGGHSMVLTGLNRIDYNDADHTLWAQAGATFQAIEKLVLRESRGSREFPASPTEKTATLGGGLSFHTMGIRGLRCGTVAQQVLEIEYCDHTGNLCRVTREDPLFLSLTEKEGMTGILTGAKLQTAAKPGVLWALIFFFDREEAAAAFGEMAQANPRVSALEYMDRACLLLGAAHRDSLPALAKLPPFPQSGAAAVYLELEADSDPEMEASAEALLMYAEEAGGDPDNSWSAAEDEAEQFRQLHHAVTECLHLRTAQASARDPGIKKLTYPLRLIPGPLPELLQQRREEAGKAGLSMAVFGHWAAGQILSLHLFAETGEDWLRGLSLMEKWYREDLPLGRAALEQAGLGKLYGGIFCREAPEEALLPYRQAKKLLDPGNRFNPGNLFPKDL